MSAAILAGINVHTSSRVQDGDDRRKKSGRPTTTGRRTEAGVSALHSPRLVTFLLFCLSSPSSTHIKPRIRPPLPYLNRPSPFRIGKTIWLAMEGVVPLWLFRPNCCGVASSDSPSSFPSISGRHFGDCLTSLPCQKGSLLRLIDILAELLLSIAEVCHAVLASGRQVPLSGAPHSLNDEDDVVQLANFMGNLKRIRPSVLVPGRQ